MTMEKKNLGLGNMNGMTDQDHRTCGINDMNCLGEQAGNAKQRLPEGVPALCGNIRGCIGSLWRGTLQAVMELYHNNIRGFAI